MRFYTRLTHLFFSPFAHWHRALELVLILAISPVLAFAANVQQAVDWDSLKPDAIVPDTLLVGFKKSQGGAQVKAATVASRRALHARVGTTLRREFSLIPVHSVNVPPGVSLKDAAARYAADPDVAYVEPNYRVYPTAIPNDPQYGSLWGMPRIHAPEAWDRTTGSSNILVAVIDTGILRTHPDLQNNMWHNPGETGLDGSGHDKATNGIDDDGNGYIDDANGWDFANNDNNPTDDQGHGTHVAGTIGAVGNNGTGVVGVNWKVSMVAVKFLGLNGGTTEDAISSVQYITTAISGVRLSNNSWGGGGYSQALKDAIDAAGAAGQLFIAAAGNESMNNDVNPHYPSSYVSSNLIAVASITSGGSLSDFSCYGLTSVDLAAPGSDILSTTFNGGYGSKSGTSMATPHVAGAAALLWSKYPDVPWTSIRKAILNGAAPNAALVGKVATGGELDLTGALAKLNPPIVTPSPCYVTEGLVTNLEVSLSMAPATDTVVSVSWLSGSTNLYVVGSPALVFTPLNWSVPQAFEIGALNDVDMVNDTAVFRASASGEGDSDFVVEQLDMGDTMPPQCVITSFMSADRSEVFFDFRFDEEVIGFEGGDLIFTSNISGGVSLVSLTDLSGSNQYYRARVAVGDVLGAVSVTVPSGVLTDQSGNLNPNPQYGATFVMPWVKNDFKDDFELGSTWTRSTNVYAGLTEDGWRFGPPVFGESWDGPASAYSGSNCWGTMDGPYSLPMDGWVQSPPIPVGGNPVLSFQLWMGWGEGYVEVKGASGWQSVVPGGTAYSTTGWAWEFNQIALNDEQFGNRIIEVRFRARDCAMYIDDVSVESQRDPAVWLVSSTPTNGVAGTTNPVSFVVYNSTTSTLSSVRGAVSSPDAGVSIAGGSPADYGLMAPGGVASSAGPVSVQLAAAGNFDFPDIQLVHHFTDAGSLSSSDSHAFTVDGVSAVVATNILAVKSSTGVTNWLGQRLQGNGNDMSCLFQVIYAGTNRVVEPPTASGQVTGDDRILYSYGYRQSIGRFGEGAGVVADLGEFFKFFAHNLASNSLVYVRAWDAASFEGAAAYGNSAVFALKSLASQTNDFGSWCVGTPAPGSFARDSNGDSVPDGWCVLNGLDPREPIAPLGTRVIAAKAATGFSYPNRVAVSSNFVFVADTENSRIQVWDRALTNRLYMLGSPSDTNFSKPRGVAVSRDGSRLAVADTAKRRVRLFGINLSTGVLTPQITFGEYGTGEGQFNDPMAVAFGPAGEIYVADSQQSGTCNNRVQIFDSTGAFQQTFGAAGGGDGEFSRLLGIGMANDGTLYAADGTNNRVQAFTSGTSHVWNFGTAGAVAGQFNRVWDAQPGVGSLLYVADFYNKRIQVLNAVNAPSINVVGVYSNAGVLGAFNLPQSAVPAPDDNVLYVADTYNSRVLRLKVTLDADGDGMDDVWETLHGLNPSDPSDALSDPDGDGVSNIGEYRVGTDPRLKNTDGDGAGDGWELANGLNPVVSNAVPAGIPVFLAMGASPASPVRPGQTVVITALYNQTMTNAPSLTLGGAVTLGPVTMSGSGTSWSYSYVVPGSVMGAVNGTVGGAIGLSGYLSDPPMLMSNALFTIAGQDLRISAINPAFGHLAWNAWSGDVFRIQSSTNLLVTNWVDGATVTSEVNGTLSVSNVFVATNQVEFMRVLWINAP